MTDFFPFSKKEPEFTNLVSPGGLCCGGIHSWRSLDLVEFDMVRAIASLDKGQPVIPIWLDQIHRTLAAKLSN